MKKIKILWFTNTPSGASEIISQNEFSGGWLSSLEKQLSERLEVDLNVAFYHGINIEAIRSDNVVYHVIERKSIKNKFTRLLHRITQTNNDNKEIIKINSIIRKVRPDLIHVHGTEDNFGLLALSNLNIPIVISIQGILNPIILKFYDGIDKFDSFVYETFLSKLFFSSVNRTFKFFLSRSKRELKILKNCNYIIGRTNWDRRVTRLLSPKSKYFTNNEILRESFYVNEFVDTKQKGEINIISIISSGHFKGLETLLRAFILLRKEKDIVVSWSIIGLNSNDSYVKLVSKYLKLNIKNIGIKFLGRKNDEEIVEYLKKADLFCQVSHIENSPNSLCEAMVLGVPVIASYAGGTSSLLYDYIDGILYQAGDHFSLSGAILEVNQNYDDAIKRAINSKNKALLRHDKNNIVDKLYQIYCEVISDYKNEL